MNGSGISMDDVGQRIVGPATSVTVEHWGDYCSDEDHQDDALCYSPTVEQRSLDMVEVVEGTTTGVC